MWPSKLGHIRVQHNLGDRFDESISNPGREIESQVVHFRSTHFQLVYWHSSLVGEQRIESAAISQLGWRVSSFGKGVNRGDIDGGGDGNSWIHYNDMVWLLILK